MGLERQIQNSSVKSVLVVNRTKYLKDAESYLMLMLRILGGDVA